MDHVEAILNEKGISYEILRHAEPIRTAREGAELLGIEIGQTAPAFILRSEAEYVAMIVSGGRGRVDLEEVSGVLGWGRLRMASPREVLRVTGHAAGSVPLALFLPCVLDKRLFRYPFVYGGTGDPASTLRIAPQDLERLNRIVAYLE